MIDFTKYDLMELHDIRDRLNAMCSKINVLNCCKECPLQNNDADYCVLYAINDVLYNYERKHKHE